MKFSEIYYNLLKRFFSYYRIPLSVMDENAHTLYCFPEDMGPYILPAGLMQRELMQFHAKNLDSSIPFLVNTPYNSFIAIIPLPTNDYLFVGPCFSMPFSPPEVQNPSISQLTQKELDRIQELSLRLPLVDESYLTDALSLLILMLHYKEVSPQVILDSNNLTRKAKTVYESSQVIESEYEELLLFEAQVFDAVKNGREDSLYELWSKFSVSIKEDFNEYLYSEHHFMIPLLSSARQAAIQGDAPKEDVVTIFHSAISQISQRGSLSINLKSVERATFDLCSMVNKKKDLPFRTGLCIKCERYIDEHIKEKITAADIAEYCGIDRSLIFDIFRKNYNISLNEYIQTEKMRRATVLLIHSASSVSEIASSLGFCSSSYFSKTFYNHYKCSPTDYRLKKRG